MDVPHGACINEITVDTAVVILSGCWVHTRVHGGQRFHGILCSGGCWGWPQHAMVILVVCADVALLWRHRVHWALGMVA